MPEVPHALLMKLQVCQRHALPAAVEELRRHAFGSALDAPMQKVCRITQLKLD